MTRGKSRKIGTRRAQTGFQLHSTKWAGKWASGSTQWAPFFPSGRAHWGTFGPLGRPSGEFSPQWARQWADQRDVARCVATRFATSYISQHAIHHKLSAHTGYGFIPPRSTRTLHIWFARARPLRDDTRYT